MKLETLEGAFSAVLTQMFARTYSLESGSSLKKRLGKREHGKLLTRSTIQNLRFEWDGSAAESLAAFLNTWTGDGAAVGDGLRSSALRHSSPALRNREKKAEITGFEGVQSVHGIPFVGMRLR